MDTQSVPTATTKFNKLCYISEGAYGTVCAYKSPDDKELVVKTNKIGTRKPNLNIKASNLITNSSMEEYVIPYIIVNNVFIMPKITTIKIRGLLNLNIITP